MRCEELWPEFESEGDRVLHWGYLVSSLGLLGGLTLERPHLLGLRGVREGAGETHETVAKADFDDTFVLLRKDVPPVVFPGCTHPYQTRSREATDGDGDGVGDVATILPGHYVLTLALEEPYPVFTFDRDPLCHRDLNHDGKLTREEIELAERKGMRASAILFHVGYTELKNPRSSIGCQTAASVWLKLVALAAGRGGKIDYTLVRAETALPAARRARQHVREGKGLPVGTV